MLRLFRVVAILVALLVAPQARAGELRVYFFDVGQGDSALIVSPTGKTVLIDAGPPEAGARLRGRLEKLLSGPLDLVILSHPHLDHMGGMEQALAAHGAQLFMDSGFSHPSPAYSSMLRFLEGHSIKVVNATQGRNIDIGGGASIAILGPPDPFFSGTRSDPNANSVIARLSFGSEHVLFSGDAEEETEQMLVRNGNLQSDVLKVPHHGSRHSSTPAFLEAVKPRFAVISVGQGNDYGHPTRAALDRLEGIGAKIFRTDLDGEVVLVTDGTKIVMHAGNDARSESESATPSDEAAPVEGKHARGKIVNVKQASARSDGYIASKKSKVFHRESCPNALRIKPENRLVFTTRRDAATGREPAKDCNP